MILMPGDSRDIRIQWFPEEIDHVKSIARKIQRDDALQEIISIDCKGWIKSGRYLGGKDDSRYLRDLERDKKRSGIIFFSILWAVVVFFWGIILFLYTA